MQKVSDPFGLPVKKVKSRTTAKVSVFVLHIVNKESNHPKTKLGTLFLHTLFP